MTSLHSRRNMQLIRYLPKMNDRPTAVAIGNFDGLHRGHLEVIAAMALAAQAKGLVSSVLTFEPHPRTFFAQQAEAFRLEPLSMKLRRLNGAGVEQVFMPRFNANFAALTADQFMQDVLATRLGAKVVVTGENFAFGKGREGNVERLRAWGAAQHVEILTVPAVQVAGKACSSSAIRQAIGLGDVKLAAKLLGHDYTLSGRIVHGDGRGAGLGYATANVALPPGLKLPAYGVYAVRAKLRGLMVDGVASFGLRPTVVQTTVAWLEVHLFDDPGMIYGEKMEVHFVAQLREEKKFASLADMTAQIANDCAAAKIALANRV